MNDFLMSYLGVVAGVLTLLGIVGVIEWAGRAKDYLHCKNTVKIAPPVEHDPKSTTFKTFATPEQIKEALEELEDESV